MRITRRQFIQYVSAAGASLGLSELQIFKLTEALAKTGSTPKLIWLQGQACNGCTIGLTQLFHDVEPELANTLASAAADTVGVGPSGTIANAYTSVVENYLDGQTGNQADIADVLFDVVDINYHQTLSGPAGYLATEAFLSTGSPFILAIEGSIPASGTYNVGSSACKVGTPSGTPGYTNDTALSLAKVFDDLTSSANCAAIVAVGQCASFGNWPASRNQKFEEFEKKHSTYYPSGTTAHYQATGALSVNQYRDRLGKSTPVIRVAGCPIRGEELYLTVAAAILNAGSLASWYGAEGVETANFDVYKRPKSVLGLSLYDKPIHSRCVHKQDFLNGVFASQWGEHASGSQNGGCLARLNCKGPSSWRSCQRIPSGGNPSMARGTWECLNGADGMPVTTGRAAKFTGTSCINAGATCMACGEPGYPDRFSHPLVNYSGYDTTY